MFCMRPDEFLQRRAEARPIGCAVDVPHRLGAAVVRRSRRSRTGPGHTRFGRAGRQGVRQHRAVPGLADRDVDRRRALHGDRFVPGRERRAALRRQIAAGIGRIDLFDENVLDIGRRRREAPGNPLVVTDHDQRHPGRGAAGNLVLRGLQPRQIPEARARQRRDAGRWRGSACRSRCARRRRPSCSRRNAAR